MRNRTNFFTLLWWIYIIVLFMVIAVKFSGSFSDLLERVQDYEEAGILRYNLQPLKSIRSMLRHVTEGWAFINLFGNIIPFIPFGFLLPLSYVNNDKLYRVFVWGLLFDIFIETFQLFTGLGVFDIDDIILNMAGITCGYLLFLPVKLVRYLKHRDLPNAPKT